MSWQGDFRTDFGSAKQANENRYQDILGGYNKRISDFGSMSGQILADYGDRYQRGMNDILGMGRSGTQDIQDSFSSQKSKIMGSAMAHGIGNSTVMQSMVGGLANDQERAKMQLSDQLARTNVKYDSILSGDMLGYKDSRLRGQMGLEKERLDFMERKVDAYPDYQTYEALGRSEQASLSARSGRAGATISGRGSGMRRSRSAGTADELAGAGGFVGAGAAAGAIAGALSGGSGGGNGRGYGWLSNQFDSDTMDGMRNEMWDAQDSFRRSQDHYFVPEPQEWSGWEFGPASDSNMPFFRDDGRPGNFYDTGNEGNLNDFYNPSMNYEGFGEGGGSWDDMSSAWNASGGGGDWGAASLSSGWGGEIAGSGAIGAAGGAGAIAAL